MFLEPFRSTLSVGSTLAQILWFLLLELISRSSIWSHFGAESSWLDFDLVCSVSAACVNAQNPLTVTQEFKV